MSLVGVNGTSYASTNAFTLTAGAYNFTPSNGTSQPSGLVDGTTNFHSGSSSGALSGTPSGIGGGVNHWQGAAFSGLSAGDYQFTWVPISSPTQEWSVLSPNMNGIFNIGTNVTTPPSQVPLPAGAALLLGALGLMGGLRSRRGKTA